MSSSHMVARRLRHMPDRRRARLRGLARSPSESPQRRTNRIGFETSFPPGFDRLSLGSPRRRALRARAPRQGAVASHALLAGRSKENVAVRLRLWRGTVAFPWLSAELADMLT